MVLPVHNHVKNDITKNDIDWYDMMWLAQAAIASAVKKEARNNNPKQSCFAYEQVQPLTNKFCFCFEA